MAIATETWCPSVEVYDRRKKPAHGTFSLDLFSDKAIKAARSWPGQVTNIRFIETSNDAFFYQDPLPGQSPFKPRILSLDYDLIFRNAGADAYLQVNTAEEKQARADAVAQYQFVLNTLAVTPEASRTDDQRRQWAGATDRINQLSQAGSGFLTTFYNLYDTKAEGVIWDLSVPNIPIDLIGKDDLGADPSVTLRILRASPLAEQVQNHNLIFKLSNGKTQYALVFGRNESVQWWHYRNMTGPKRLALEKQLQTIEDTGRLTAADNVQLRAWREDISDIKEAAKTAGRPSTKLTDAEKTAIKEIKGKIKEKEESKKGLSAEDEKNKAEILKKLFYAQVPVNLQEDTKSLYDRIFDITIRFLRKGQVQIQMDKNPAWTWTNVGISKLRGYYNMLPANARLLVHSDGGAFGFAVGRPRYKANGLLYTAEVQPGYEIFWGEFLWEWDADFKTEEYDAESGVFTGTGPYGTRVEARLQQTAPASIKGGIIKPPTYQIQLELFSDEAGAYSPEVHHVHFRVLAGECPPLGAPVWESLPSGNPKAKQSIADVVCQDNSDSSPYYAIKIENKYGEQEALGLPKDLAGREIVLKMINANSGVTYDMLLPGVLKRAEMDNRGGLLSSFLGMLGFRVTPRAETTLHTVGLEAQLDKDIRFPVNGNNKYPNDFIRQLLRNAGLRASEYVGVGEGDIGIKKTKPPVAGEPPDIRPEPSSRYWEYLQNFVSTHCKGWRLVVRGTGVILEEDTYRDRPDFAYSTAKPSWDLYHIKKGFQVIHDPEEFFTEAVFTGQVDPQVGRRWAATKSIPQATDERFAGKSLYHVGSEKIYVAPVDDSLQDYESCVLAARQFMARKGLPPWYVKFTAAYNPGVRGGDIIRVDGYKVVVENIQRGTIKPGAGETPKMDLTARFYQDYQLTEAAPV